MAEIKDKLVTVASLSELHEYNKTAYMSKVIDFGSAPFQYNPADFTSFILEVADEENDEARHIVFTNKTSNSSTLDTKAQAFQFDSEGNMQLYELSFYWGDGGYSVDSTLSTFTVATGDKTSSSFAYTKIYGIQYI